jgi:hypothetical protein
VQREVNGAGEPTVIHRFDTLAVGRDLPAGKKSWPIAFTVDALEGLEETPETLLLTTAGELLLLPVDTAPDAIDPAAPDLAPVKTSKALRANPVRINFEPVEAATQ